MVTLNKLYSSELRRIRKSGVSVRHNEQAIIKIFGTNTAGCYNYPNTIFIDPGIKSFSCKLAVLLHEEGHHIDKELLSTGDMWREYRAERYSLQRAIELNNKYLLKYIIKHIKDFADLRFRRRYPHLAFYHHAFRKLKKTKLWRQAVRSVQ